MCGNNDFLSISDDRITVYVKPVESFLKRLYYRSVDDPKAVFYGLYKELNNTNLLCYAALKILGNQGAYTAGIDKIAKGIFLRTFDKQILDIQKDIIKGIKPLAVERVYIPKPGKTEKRPLGIPAIKDKVIQEAIRLMLEAIYEPTFKRNSVGFRCGFSTQDALKDCWAYMQPCKKMQYVLEFDIKKFFDNVDHKILYKILGEKIHDRRFRNAIWRIMKAEICEDGINKPNNKGVPQGGVISPLLANIYMHKFDEFMETMADRYSPKHTVVRVRYGVKSVVTERSRPRSKKMLKELGLDKGGSLGYVRYADDGVAFWNGQLKELYAIKQRCKDFLMNTLKLELSEEKTIITNVDKGFKFVGFYFIRKRTMNSQKGVGKFARNAVVLAPKSSIHKIKVKITEICRESTIKGYDESYTILKLNKIIDGCYNYFQNTSYPSSVNSNIFGHACVEYWYYLKRRGFTSKEAKKRFWKTIDRQKTWTFNKYAIRVPPPTQKEPHKKEKIGLVGITHTDRYHLRKTVNRITRIFPNDPIVPMKGDWRLLRNKILTHNGYKCVFCGKQATQVDHVLTKAECKCDVKLSKVRDKSQYLRSLCTQCHIKRHGKTWSWSVMMDLIDSINNRKAGTCQTTSEANGSLH